MLLLKKMANLYPPDTTNTQSPSTQLQAFPVPSQQMFDTLDDARRIIDEFTGPHGYALTINRSVKKKGELVRVYLQCDRGGEYVDRQTIRRRNRTTRQTCCPFSAVLSNIKTLNSNWHLRIRNPNHNHEPSSSLQSHPSLRARAR